MDKGVCPNRTVDSLKAHWKDHLKYELDLFDVTEDDLITADAEKKGKDGSTTTKHKFSLRFGVFGYVYEKSKTSNF